MWVTAIFVFINFSMFIGEFPGRHSSEKACNAHLEILKADVARIRSKSTEVDELSYTMVCLPDYSGEEV